MTLQERRRALTAQKSFTPSVPSGYITDGLVLFLDAKQYVGNGKWIDCAGGKEFTLYNCTATANAVVFDGTAYGETTGTITTEWANETVEVAMPESLGGTSLCGIINQPLIDGNTGISLVLGAVVSQRRTCGIATDGTRRTFRQISATANRIGVNSGVSVNNGSTNTYTDNNSYAGANEGVTTIGCRCVSTRCGKMTGKICAIRIYNRKLTADEIKSNQAKDASYYGIS